MDRILSFKRKIWHMVIIAAIMVFSCGVIVNAEEADSTKVTIENAYAVVGHEVEVVVGITNGIGIGAYELNIAYDNNAVEFVKGESLIQTLAWDANDNGSSTYITAVLTTDVQNDTYLQVMKLTFRVKGEALEGNYPLYISEGIMVSGQTGEGVFFDISDGVINVSEKLIGDVDEDAKINIADAMMVFRFVAGKDVEAKEVIEQNGDVNGDGEINIIDAMMLFHYVSDRIDTFVRSSKNDVENESISDNDGEVIESDSIGSAEIPTQDESTSIDSHETTNNQEQETEETTRKPEQTTEKGTSKEEEPTPEKDTAIAVTGISLDKTEVSMDKGAMLVLRTTVSPSNASNKSVTWSSSNTSVATVSNNGRVTAVGNGTATITVKTNDGSKTAACKVTVITSVTIVEIDKTSLSLNKGDSTTLTATVMPAAASNKTVTWSSSNTSVATVNSSGKIIAVGNGTATITVKTADGGKTATCKVTVKTPVTGVSLNKTNISLNKGGTSTLTATVNPSTASNKAVTWSSSNTAVATVNSSGKITAVGNGTATITVKTADGGKTASCTVTVKTPTTAVTGVSLNKTSVTLEKGTTTTLVATVSPSAASNKSLTWSSSNTAVATVDSSGKVTAVGNGTATITVKTADGGKTATCKVTTKTSITRVNIEPSTVSLKKGATTTLSIGLISPSDATDKTFTWSSSNTSVATVNSSGKVTAVGNGTTVIVLKRSDGATVGECKVTVTTAVTGVSITNKKDVVLDCNSSSSKYYQCSISVSPSTASNKAVTWSSSDTSIATVDSNGKITAKTIGTATITVKTADGSKTDTIKVYVYKSNAAIPKAGNTWYRVSIGSVYNRIMEVENASTSNGSKVQLAASTGSYSQLWQFGDRKSKYGGIAIIPKCNSGSFILNVTRSGGALKENNLINLWTIGVDNATSMWELVRTWDGGYIFRLVNTNWVAGVTSTSSGAQLMLRKFDLFDMNQRWYLEAVDTSSSSFDVVTNKIASLRTKYVHGQYWNQYNGLNKTGTIICPCGTTTCYGNCSCSCGQFYYNGQWIAGQCHGFALKMAYEVFGENANNWSRHKNVNSIYAGDVIRINNDTHSVFVTKVDGDKIYYVDCNWTGRCKVRWDGYFTRSQLSGCVTYIAHKSGNTSYGK